MLMKCSYDNGPNGSTRLNQTLLNYKIIPGYGKAGLTFVLAGYYLQTNAIENPNMQFKLRVWAGTKKVHEAIIKKHYSYAVNRSADKAESGKRGYVFNRMHYFKKGVNSSSIRFEIIPIVEDRALKRDPVRYTKKLLPPQRLIKIRTRQDTNIFQTKNMTGLYLLAILFQVL